MALQKETSVLEPDTERPRSLLEKDVSGGPLLAVPPFAREVSAHPPH